MLSNDAFAPYRAKLESLRQSPYLDSPAHVHIETLALCPAACNFCPYPTLTRKGERMDDALLDKILVDLMDFPRHLPFQLSPFKVNEPLLDPRLLGLLQRVERDLPQAMVSLTSNAVPLTEAQLLELAELKQLAYLWVSLNEYEPEAYTRVMGLPWERTTQRLDLLHRTLAQGRLRFRVVASRVGDGSPRDQAFRDWVRQHYPLFAPSVLPRGGWLGQVEGLQIGDVPDVGCVRWFDLSITATGTVAHCCMDGQADWPIGDARSQHLLEIYNQPDYRRLREQGLSRLQTEPCQGCTFL